MAMVLAVANAVAAAGTVHVSTPLAPVVVSTSFALPASAGNSNS
jgi:hypothetical protein